MNTARCDWSDLSRDQCDHCGAHPGSTIVLETIRPAKARAAADNDEAVLEKPRLPETWAPSNDAGECRCGRPTRDGAWVCDECTADFQRLLGDLGALDEELAITITKQRAAATTGGPRGSETSLPWHERAGDARRALHGLLVSWVRFCSEEDVKGPQIGDPADSIPSLASWLATRASGLALTDIGPEAIDEITNAAAECHRIVFWKRRSRIYLGTCGAPIEEVEDEATCPGEVYAEEGEPIGYCDDCGQGVTVVIRKSEIDKRLDDRLCTPAEIATYAVHLGLEVPREQVRRRVNYWHRHHLIEQKGTAENGAPLFRYGQVRNQLYAEFAQRAS